MPNSRQTSLIDSPSSNLATNRRRSSITEHSFHGIDTSRSIAESVTHVPGTTCYLCLGPLKILSKIKSSSLLWDPEGPFIHKPTTYNSAGSSRHPEECAA